MRTSYSDRASGGTGWSAVAVTNSAGKPEPGGLVLKDIRHDGHNLARDIRMLRMLLTVEVVDASGSVTGLEAYWFELDDARFFTATAVGEHRPSGGSLTGAGDIVAPFSTYFGSTGAQTGYALRVEYAGRAGMFGRVTNFEFAKMDAVQTFLFSHHGTSPAHEPSGALPAARLHPLLNYGFVANAAYDTTIEHRRLQSIRFDYRLHLAIDATHTAVDASPPDGNNAGLFRDHDTFSLARGALALASGAEHFVFEAVEKPAVLEVVAPGLAKGAASFPTGPVSANMNRVPAINQCWDNVHWWGSGVGSNIISSPGAFHAAHIHWRWGGIAAIAPQGGGAQFGPGGAPSAVRGNFLNSYGILVDPRIWIQSIRFAVTLNDPAIDPDRGVALADLSRVDWKTRFTGLRTTPSDIFSPQDIVLWYSTEVHRTVTVPSITVFTPPNYTSFPGGSFTAGTQGVVFLHGIFFAHSAERTGRTVGSRNTQHWPNSVSSIRSAGQWFRPAS